MKLDSFNRFHFGHKCNQNERFVRRWFGNEKLQTIHTHVLFGDSVILPIRVLQLKSDSILIDMENVTTLDGAELKIEANVVLSIKDDNPNQLWKTLQNPDAGIVETNQSILVATIQVRTPIFSQTVRELMRPRIDAMTVLEVRYYITLHNRELCVIFGFGYS